MSRQWTPAQLRAISISDRHLLVSAAAGSGKTAVLAERFKYLVCDAEGKCDVDEILVVTFTNDAAAEMRKRISLALAERAAGSDDARLKRQALLVSSAHISTIHGMASTILRRHFHELGLDPNFRLLDEDESKLMRNEIVTELLEDRFDDLSATDFRRVVDDYCNGQVSRMSEFVLSLHAKLSSLVDPVAWLAERRARLDEAIKRPLSESILGDQFKKQLLEHLQSLVFAVERLRLTIERTPEIAPYAKFIAEKHSTIIAWGKAISDFPWNEARLAIPFDWGRAPSIKGKSTHAEAIKARIDKLKDQMHAFVADGQFGMDEATLRESLAQTLNVTDQLADLANEFNDRYRARKRDLGVLDFNDLEHYALQVLREPGSNPARPSHVAREYQRQFKHLMVDEYQDVNELQDTILTLLSSGGKHFAVGDVKQSIYRFRQADPRCFMSRDELYRDAMKNSDQSQEVIDLQQNFRSRGPLLETLNGFFSRLMTRESAEVKYDQTHWLVPGARFADDPCQFSGSPVELHVIDAPVKGADTTSELESSEREAVLAAGRILEMLGRTGKPAVCVTDRDQSVRPIEPRDIAILLRSTAKKAERFASVLRRAGIPVLADSKTGFFSASEILDLIHTLRLLGNARDDIALATFIRSPLSGCNNADDAMAEIRLAYPSHGTACFHRAFAKYIVDQKSPLRDSLAEIDKTLCTWREFARSHTVAELLWHILRETSYLSYLAGLPDGQQRVANVMNLYERALAFGAFQSPTVARFVEFLRLVEDESDQGMPPVAGVSVNAVRIMTIHRSKGLEFPVVILPDLGKKHNLRDGNGLVLVDDTVGIAARVVDARREIHYPSIATAIARESIRAKSIAEELRVLYVATTRAREHLILIGTAAAERHAEWDDAWRGHRDAIPAGDVRRAASMLEWIGPAAAMLENDQPGLVDRQIHTIEEIESAAKALAKRSSTTAIDKNILELKALTQKPVMTPETQAVIARLAYEYPYEPLTQTPAAESVTSRTKSGRETRGGRVADIQPAFKFTTVLKLPRCIAGAAQTAADVGTVTHTVLQHLDFARANEPESLKRQLEELAERRFIRREQISAVDLSAVEWFLNTPLGIELRSGKYEVMREISIAFADANASGDPQDAVMVRGRIDAIMIHDGVIHVIDYKTDRVTAENVDERAAFYRPQVELYAQQLQRMTDAKLIKTSLVFLNPRQIRSY